MSAREQVAGFADSKKEIAEQRAFLDSKLAGDADVVSRVVYSLEWDYCAAIDGIGCDQWCAISASTHDSGPEGLSVWMQCDSVEDGFVFVWRAFFDKYGDERDRAEVFKLLREQRTSD